MQLPAARSRHHRAQRVVRRPGYLTLGYLVVLVRGLRERATAGEQVKTP